VVSSEIFYHLNHKCFTGLDFIEFKYRTKVVKRESYNSCDRKFNVLTVIQRWQIRYTYKQNQKGSEVNVRKLIWKQFRGQDQEKL